MHFTVSKLLLPVVLQDTWLLHSVLMLVQSWIEPLIYLQTTLDQYDNAPVILLNKTKWVSEKLISLEQGVVVLIKKVGLINHRVAVRAKKKVEVSANACWALRRYFKI